MTKVASWRWKKNFEPMKNSLVGLLIILAGVSPIYAVEATEGPALPRVVLETKGIDLQRWLLIGSFEAKPREAAVEVDFLAGLGKEEGVCVQADLAAWAGSLPQSGKGRPTVRLVEGADVVDFGKLYDSQPLSILGLPQTAVYAACEIVAPTSQEAWLLLGADDGAKVWLNGELRYAWRERRMLIANDEAIRLPLQPGANLILIKITNFSGRWKFQARLEIDKVLAAQAVLDADDVFLLSSSSVISPDTSLEYQRTCLGAFNLPAQLESFEGEVIR